VWSLLRRSSFSIVSCRRDDIVYRLHDKKVKVLVWQQRTDMRKRMKRPDHYPHNLAIMSLVSTWLIPLKGIIISKTFVLSPCRENGSCRFSKDVFLFNFCLSNNPIHIINMIEKRWAITMRQLMATNYILTSFMVFGIQWSCFFAPKVIELKEDGH
jgi:hypothetical protein